VRIVYVMTHQSYYDDSGMSQRPLEKDVRRRGGRGGTYLTDEDVDALVARCADYAVPVDEHTMMSVEYLKTCQEKADAYDWTEYFEQMPKIERLIEAVKSRMETQHNNRSVDPRR